MSARWPHDPIPPFYSQPGARGDGEVTITLYGDVREVPFHLAYSSFSIIAALAMLSLARRFCDQPFLATLLFIAVPAFVVNGNSLESDLPLLALWMLAVAWFDLQQFNGFRADVHGNGAEAICEPGQHHDDSPSRDTAALYEAQNRRQSQRS